MMKKGFLILLAVFSLSACVRSIDGYTSSPDIVSAMSAYSSKKVNVGEFEAFLGEGVIGSCRGYSVITTPDKRSLTQYIQDAFISELELANAYSPDSPIIISGQINQISLSTLHTGEWIIKMTLTSNNGRSISAKERYEFTSNVVGQSACQNASDTFVNVVQEVLYKLVTSPQFKLLLEPSRYPKTTLPQDKPPKKKQGAVSQPATATPEPAAATPTTVTAPESVIPPTQAVPEGESAQP